MSVLTSMVLQSSNSCSDVIREAPNGEKFKDLPKSPKDLSPGDDKCQQNQILWQFIKMWLKYFTLDQ